MSVASTQAVAQSPVMELRGTANILAHARKNGWLHQPGEVTQEQTQKIVKLVGEIVMNSSNQQAALANFKVILGSDDTVMQTRKSMVDEATASMGRPMSALTNATAGFFQKDLQIKLKGMFDMMKAAFPQKAASLDPALAIGVKMAIIPKMENFLKQVETVSRSYVGNLIQAENAAQV